MTKRAEICKKLTPLLRVYVIIIIWFGVWPYIWLWIHELLHWSICWLEGYYGRIIFDRIFPHAVECPEIMTGTVCAKFLWAIGPYVTNIFTVILFNVLPPRRMELRLIPYVATFDSLANCFAAPYRITDFGIIVTLPNAFIFAAEFLILATFVGAVIYFLREDYQPLKKSMRRLWQRKVRLNYLFSMCCFGLPAIGLW